jgi:acetyl-CoA carboxylase carboxyltransferase component
LSEPPAEREVHLERDVHAELAARLEAARLGGPNKYRRRQVEAGKLLVRDRLKLLLDAEADFEDGLLARSEEGLAGDAVVTAVGRLAGRTVCVIANDYTVKAGTWGRRTFDEITRMQQVAGEIGAPLIYLIDSAGRGSTSSSRATRAATPGATSSTTRSSSPGGCRRSASCSGPRRPARRTCPRCAT